MALRRLLLAWLAFALMAAQGLAVLHRLAHLPGAGGPATATASAASGAGHWLADLFRGHDDDAGCRLLDAVGQQAAPPPVLLLALPLLPACVARCWQGEAVARWAALFDARGPPILPSMC